MKDLGKKFNRLKKEKSPYLLQHADNPVDWYPWSEEAFNKAKSENKPIFLSIGYSTCHWCHVMAQESFEDMEVAKHLNNNFVCIKVDREERPDIDKIYMNICQIMTGAGGWPLTIIMTPTKKPFFAATYIPKQTRFGIKGLLTLIPEINKQWKNNKDQLLNSANEITSILQKITKPSLGKGITKETLDSAYQHLFDSFDEQHGGFGYQPKFPTPHKLIFLLRYWKRTGKNYCLKMVNFTLEQMRHGGIFDHIGFGFHRYSTDRKWLIPHFEKMLYDQALLIMSYAEAYQATKKPIFKKTAAEIIEYVFRDLSSEGGGFYSAEDADSEGEEGKFYTWNFNEIRNLLTPKELDIATKFYNIKKEGNCNINTKNSQGKNIFYQTMSVDDFAKFYHVNKQQLSKQLETIRKKLFNARENRVHPDKDDKILTDWNGLMIAALAIAARVFDEKLYVEKAEKCANFILNNMLQISGALFHRYRDNELKIQSYADDYAFLIMGLIELYQVTFNPKYIQSSIHLNNYLLNHFWDKKSGGLFFTADTNERLLTKTKEIYDGAIPSANSVTMSNLFKLSKITGDINLELKALEIGKIFSNQILLAPSGYTQLLLGADFAIGHSYEIIIVGNEDKEEVKKIIQGINSIYLPNKVIILKAQKSKKLAIEKIAPFLKEYFQIKNKATIYVCKNQQCQQPTTDIKKMMQYLN